jgi:hypothetical protein
VTITGFAAGADDTAGASLARPAVNADTFASFPRFGAFDAYGSWYTAFGTKIVDMDSFVTAMAIPCARLGVPVLETAATLALRLATAYGVPLDVDAAVEFYVARGMTKPAADSTTAVTLSRTYPTAFATQAARTQTYVTGGLVPSALVATRWPWSAGYKANGGSLGTAMPSGYFLDPRTLTPPTALLPVVANVGATLPTVSIRVAVSGKRYLSIDASTNPWAIGGLKPDGNAVIGTAFTSTTPSFGGTALAAAPAAVMTAGLSGIRYTSVSWVGCAFHNSTCLASESGAKQGFPWAGFYCGGAAVTGTAPMDNAGTKGKLVWDLGKANGEAYSGTASYVTAAVNNVLMWTPLKGTDPADRETLHAFTLVVDNLAGATGFAGQLVDWVQLYQNGVKLTMDSVTSSTLYTVYST